jgi:hypothetical protein
MLIYVVCFIGKEKHIKKTTCINVFSYAVYNDYTRQKKYKKNVESYFVTQGLKQFADHAVMWISENVFLICWLL